MHYYNVLERLLFIVFNNLSTAFGLHDVSQSSWASPLLLYTVLACPLQIQRISSAFYHTGVFLLFFIVNFSYSWPVKFLPKSVARSEIFLDHCLCNYLPKSQRKMELRCIFATTEWSNSDRTEDLCRGSLALCLLMYAGASWSLNKNEILNKIMK